MNNFKVLLTFTTMFVLPTISSAQEPSPLCPSPHAASSSAAPMVHNSTIIRSIDKASQEPLLETATIATPGAQSNIVDGKFVTLLGEASVTRPKQGYYNAVDVTPNYTYLRVDKPVGWNEALGENLGRTGVYANRVKLVHDGQGDAVAYNASVRVRGAPRAGTSNWIASPAGVLFNGTISGETDGVYLNPFEIHMVDTPVSTAYNVAAYGLVINGNRNKAGGPGSTFGGTGIGQIWGGARFQSEGSVPWDNIISAEGRFLVGLDLSMDSADFGASKAAIALKSGDRIYFGATAGKIDTATRFVRANKLATDLSDSGYITWDSSTHQLQIYVKDTLVATISSTQIQASRVVGGGRNPVSLDAGALVKNVGGVDQTLVGGRVKGWTRMTGAEDKSTAFDTSKVTLQQLAERVKALESALHSSANVNGLIGP